MAWTSLAQLSLSPYVSRQHVIKTDLGNWNEYIALLSSGMIMIMFVIIGHLFRKLKMASHNALSSLKPAFLFSDVNEGTNLIPTVP